MEISTIKIPRTSSVNPLGNEDVIYVESTYDKGINEFIREHYQSIYDGFKSGGLNFIYIPLLSEQLRHFSKSVEDVPALTTVEYIDNLFDGVFPDIRPSLLVKAFDVFDASNNTFLAFNICSDDLDDTYILADEIHSALMNHMPSLLQAGGTECAINIFECRNAILPSCETEGDFQKSFDDECFGLDCYSAPQLSKREKYQKRTLSDEEKAANEIIEMMKKSGITLQMLQMMIAKQRKQSGIVVDEDFGISLPDYDAVLDFNPMEKTIYLLFLNHPEGIMLSHLQDHQKEMVMYYSTIRNTDYGDTVPKAIVTATDPMSDTGIMPSLSRINRKIKDILGEEISANPYMILRDRVSGKQFINLVKEYPDKIIWQ